MSKHIEQKPFAPKARAQTLFLDPSSVVICDPDAPLEYGCRVLLIFSDLSGAIAGRCLTKHPHKTKSIRASFKDYDGKMTWSGGWPTSGPARSLRIVAEFPTALPALQKERPALVLLDRAS